MLSFFFFTLLVIGSFQQNLGGYTYEEFNEFNYEDSGRNWNNFNWQCLTGMSQSPVEIDNTTSIPLQRNYILNLQKAATVSGIDIINNGHSLQANYPWIEFQVYFIVKQQQKATNVQGQVKQYKAVQLHFHTPSEHSYNGQLRDLEMHIVCDQVGGPTDNGLTKGVFAIIFEYSEFYFDNPLIEPFSQAAAGYAPGFSPHTPPCTEIVEWYVIKQALPISFKQLWNFQQLWTYNFNFAQGNGNNRIVQKINGRTIVQGIVTANIQIYAKQLQYGIFMLIFLGFLLLF